MRGLRNGLLKVAPSNCYGVEFRAWWDEGLGFRAQAFSLCRYCFEGGWGKEAEGHNKNCLAALSYLLAKKGYCWPV